MKKIILLFVVSAASIGSSMAQGFKVESVRMILEDPDQSVAKDLKQCKEDIEAAKVHSKTSNDPKMWYYRGLTYYMIYATGDSAIRTENPRSVYDATESFNKAIELDTKAKYSENAKFYLLNCAVGLYNEGINSYKEQKYQKAIDDYALVTKIIAFDEKGELKRKNVTVETMYQYSYYAAQADGNYKLAKDYIGNLIALNYADVKIYIDMANILLIEKDTAGALNFLEKGKMVKENDKNLMNMELDIYLKQGKSQVLIEKLNKAIDEDPENKIYYFARAVSYEGLNDSEKAEADYKKASELDPSYYDAFYNLGVLYINKCNPIIEKLEKVYTSKEIDPLEAAIDKNYKVAIGYFEKAFDNPQMSNLEKSELAGTMKKIYARLNNVAKTNEMKDIIEKLK
jgi:tetratricopeptide (TPR) repeat protein